MGATTRLAVEVVNGNPAERILVIAPGYRAFVEWCRENGVNHRAANLKCVLRADSLRGYRDAWYVFLGVPDGREGLLLLDLFERMKAAYGLKSAYVTAKGEPPDGS